MTSVVPISSGDADDGWPGADDPGGPDDGRTGHGRRRRIAWTVVGAVAAVGVGAAIVSPKGDDAARPTVTTPAPSGTTATSVGGTPATTGSSSAAGSVGYLIDPTAAAALGFVPVGGLSPSAPAAEPPGRMRMWATQGASRTDGTWVAIQRVDEPAPTAVQDAARVDVGGEDAFVVAEPDGVVSLLVPAVDGTSIWITSYGVGPTELVELAAAVRATTPEGEAGVLSSQPYGRGEPFHLLLDRHSTGHGLGADLLTRAVQATAYYRDDAGRIVSVTTTPRNSERDGVFAPFVLRGLDIDVEGERTDTRGDIGLAGHPALGALHVVSFSEGDVTVRVASTRSDVDLDAVAAATVAGDADQWQAVQARGRGFVDGRGISYTTAASGTFPDGAAWTLSLASSPTWGSFFVAEGDGTGAFAELYLDRSPCASVASRSATTVVCVRPGDAVGEPGASLVVGDPTAAAAIDAAVPFAATDSGWSVAVARVDAAGPLPLIEVADGRAPVTLGRTGGDVAGWTSWAALDPDASGGETGSDPAATDVGWVTPAAVPGLTSLGATSGQPSEPSGTLAIWGTPDADRTSGTWVAVAAVAGGGVPPIAEDGTRVRIDGDGGPPVDAMLQTSPDGVLTLTWSPADGGAATMLARGLTEERLLRLAIGVRITTDPTTHLPAPRLAVAPTTDDGTPLAELASLPATTIAPGYVGLSEPSRWVYFIDERGAVIAEMGVQPASLGSDLAARLLIGPDHAGDPAVDAAALSAIGSDVVTGTIRGEPAWRTLRARIGDDVLTLVSRAPLATLVPSLAGLRPATTDEWAALLAATADWQSTLGVVPTKIGSGGADDGGWIVALQDVSGLVAVQDGFASWWLAMEPSADRPIRVLRTIDRTYVIALLPAPDTATALQVTVDGGDPVTVPLVASTTGFSTWVGAAYAVDAVDEATLHVALV